MYRLKKRCEVVVLFCFFKFAVYDLNLQLFLRHMKISRWMDSQAEADRAFQVFVIKAFV